MADVVRRRRGLSARLGAGAVPYDAATAGRVRRLLAPHAPAEERVVAGGLSSSVGGRVVCGVTAAAPAGRVGADAVPGLPAQPHVGPVGLGSRHVQAFVLVDRRRRDRRRPGRVVAAWSRRGRGTPLSRPADLRSSRRGPESTRRGR
ncbi:hypothetical protein ACI8AA_02710 [Geodermatophilus sp. SYSU D01180]